MYEAGRGVAADLPTAVEWYQKGARQGNGAALRRMGLLYENGRGVTKDDALAFSHFNQAALAGDRPAMLRLAAIYGAGELGRAPDPALAKQWQDLAGRTPMQ
jgi:TPR repeat protein